MRHAPTLLRLGGTVLDLDRGLARDAAGVETLLRPKTLELLRLLLRQAGQLTTRAEILDTVWPDLHVSDDSITQCVVELRRALGADAECIRTVPKRGYLLDVPPLSTPEPEPPPHAIVSPAPLSPPPLSAPPLSAAPAPVPAAPAPSVGATLGRVPVVAVLPFRLQPAKEPRLALIADGVLEGVVGALAGLREPVVISANSTRHLAEAEPATLGARLGVQYLASGTLRQAGERLRLTVELADAGGGVLWSRGYDLVDADVFETQDRIAAVIAHTLAPRVQQAELRAARRAPPAVLGAYHLLLQARQAVFRLEPDSFAEAGEMLHRAIALDPGFAPGYAALADWHSLRLGQGWSPDPVEEGAALEAAVGAALELDPDNARALALLGHSRMLRLRDYEGAVALIDRALDAGPNDAEAWMRSSPTFAYLGDAPEAIRRAERAIALSPEDPLIFRYQHYASIAHYAAGDLEAAASWGLRSVRANPRYTSALRKTAAALAGCGRAAEAAPLVAQVMALEPGFRVAPMIARHAYRSEAARRLYGERLVAAGLPA